ncbi:MAG: hypothetical protein AB8B50_14395 [Pirellulaceae bacterium]
MQVESYSSMPRGLVPNSRFPVLVYRGAIAGGGKEAVKEMFLRNGWLNNWEYPGVYTYGHFHSTTHESLGCAVGWMDLELFGEGGEKIRLEAGDALIMPAGVSHEMIGQSDDVMVVGGYPLGREWDNISNASLNETRRREAAKRIMMLPIPDGNPVNGAPITEWIEAPSSVDAGWNEFRDGLDVFE